MPVRNVRVAAGFLTSTAFTIVYTVPAGFTFILKNVVIQQASGAPTPFAINLVAFDTGFSILVAQTDTDAHGIVYWSGWTVLNSSDILRLQVSVPSAVYWVSGAVLPFSPGIT